MLLNVAPKLDRLTVILGYFSHWVQREAWPGVMKC
jgi:hypothetical protein